MTRAGSSGLVLADGGRFTFSNTGGQDLHITMGDYWRRRIVFTGSSTGVLTSVIVFQIHHGNLVAAEHLDYGNLGADDVRQLRHFAVDPNPKIRGDDACLIDGRSFGPS